MASEDSRPQDEGQPPELARPVRPEDDPIPAGSRAVDKACRPCKGPVGVYGIASAPRDTAHLELNVAIRYQTEATAFPAYKAFMDELIGSGIDGLARAAGDAAGGIGLEFRRRALDAGEGNGHKLLKIHGTIPFELLRLATEVFLLTRCGPTCVDFRDGDGLGDFIEGGGRAPFDPERLGTDADDLLRRVEDYLQAYVPPNAATPYLQQIVAALPQPSPNDRLGLAFRSRWQCPSMIELIWSYWHEEGGQSQAMNAIALRFQNRLSRPGRDPLANLTVDPLRPLSNLLWGWVEASYKRLTVERRAYEYDHHYGITLLGKAVPPLLSADSRSKFLEAFHSLLQLAHHYYVERADTMRVPDGFPLLNALRHVHLVLAEGAHNQYGDLPWTARVEMLIEQWLLARPEMREFLRGRVMVPYRQEWMSQVDTMKKLQGWSDVSVTHFHELATCGEAILLSVRHGPWEATNDQEEAKSWADYWRPEIQRYIYSYKATTGADLTLDPVNTALPARLLQARLARQRSSAML